MGIFTNKKPLNYEGLVNFYGSSWTLNWWSWRESNPRPTTIRAKDLHA